MSESGGSEATGGTFPVYVLPHQLLVEADDTAADLLEKYNVANAERAESDPTFYAGEDATANTHVLVKDGDLEAGAEDAAVPADLSTLETGDKIHAYKLAEDARPAYPGLLYTCDTPVADDGDAEVSNVLVDPDDLVDELEADGEEPATDGGPRAPARGAEPAPDRTTPAGRFRLPEGYPE